eukprot:203760-Rhodomonas_salina.1
MDLTLKNVPTGITSKRGDHVPGPLSSLADWQRRPGRQSQLELEKRARAGGAGAACHCFSEPRGLRCGAAAA